MLEYVILNRTRTEFVSLLREWGANIETEDVQSARNEPIGRINVKGCIESRSFASEVRAPVTTNEPRRISKEVIPALIDELPLIAVVGSQVDRRC